MTSIMDRECVVCRHVVEVGNAYYYNFTTGQYRHQTCGLDQEGPREAGRERLVTPPTRAEHTPCKECQVEVDHSLGQVWDSRIVYCPLHEAAPALLAIGQALDERITRGVDDSPASMQEWDRLHADLLSAIAKATGGHHGLS